MLKKIVTVLLLLALIVSQFAFATKFNDTQSHWSHVHVERLTDNAVVNGYPDGSFKPDNTMTIAEAVTVLVRSMKFNTAQTRSNWYDVYFEAARLEKMINTGNEYVTKTPNQPITREQVVVLINNLLEAKLDTTKIALKSPSFSDVKMTDALKRVYTLNLIKGYPDGTFRPNGTMTRAEISTVIDRMFFGVRDKHNDLIALPVFDIYLSKFDRVNRSRYQALLTNQKPLESHQGKTNGLLIVGSPRALTTLQSNEYPIYDLRDRVSFDYAHVKGSRLTTKFELLNKGSDLLLLVNDKRISDEDIKAYTNQYKVVQLYIIDKSHHQVGHMDYDLFEGTFKKATGKVPQYLQKRFEKVASAYNLTWTDADFKKWWDSSDWDEKGKYLFPHYRRAIPVIDFENKTLKVSNYSMKLDGYTPTNPLDPAQATLGLDDMEYITYEVLKRNIEYMMKDGADWGQVNIYYLSDMPEYGLFIEVQDRYKDPYGHSETTHFQMMVSGREALADKNIFIYWVNQLADEDVYVHQVGQVPYTEYVAKNAKMNMQLINGIDFGEKIYKNYMDGYRDMMTLGNKSIGNRSTTIDGYKVVHIMAGGSGYQMVFKK